MNLLAKQATAVFVNLALISHQLSAELSKITFDSAEWIPYESLRDNPLPGWSVSTGNALVSGGGGGFQGGKALKILPNALEEAKVTRTISWNALEKTAFIDFHIRPPANAENSLSNIVVNGTQIAFQVPEGQSTGQVWVYNGNDGAPAQNPEPEEWLQTVGTFPINAGENTSAEYLRMTFRQDYHRNLWDLYINGKLTAANLVLEQRGANLTHIDFYGSHVGDVFVDNLAALKDNMLFVDADKDGLPDAWEIANGGNPNAYDRDSIKAGTGRSFLDLYIDSLWETGNTNGGVPNQIPELTIDNEAPHVPVGAIKGSLSVGGDGTANYSVPIDLPKGTAGLEPSISLSYSSGSGNGVAGLGWNISGLQRITRGPNSVNKDGQYDPVDFDPNDRFFLDGQRLICVTGEYGQSGSIYKTEIDSFSRITAIGSGPASWKVETKSGLTVILGNTADSVIASPSGTIAWAVNQVQDTAGNYYTVSYAKENTPPAADFDVVDHRVSRISYTGNIRTGQQPYCHAEFSYETRPDRSTSYSRNIAGLTQLRLSSIQVRTGSNPNHNYRLEYSTSYQSGRSLLKKVTKLVPAAPGAVPSLAIPATTFNYDGLKESEPLWKNPGPMELPSYSAGIDASSEVNSMVDTNSDGSMIQLFGDAARAYRLPGDGVQLKPTTRIQFDFYSNAQSTLNPSGAMIGVDEDTNYAEGATDSRFYRIGGVGTIQMANGMNFDGPVRAYTPGTWQTYDYNIGTTDSSFRKFLVLMCVDNENSDGTDHAFFRNIRIYTPGEAPIPGVSPILFDVGVQLPKYSDANGRSLGVSSMDLDGDGLPEVTDWRVAFYNNSLASFLPNSFGDVYRTDGETFSRDNSIRPPVSLPLNVRPADTAFQFIKKHAFTARPVDVDGDGLLDLMGSVNIETIGNGFRNNYWFYTLKNGAWVEKPEWRLPFTLDAQTGSPESLGGIRRTHHFEWIDLNSDGFQDLVVHLTPGAKIREIGTGVVRANGDVLGQESIVYRNKGNTPGWAIAPNLRLPMELTNKGVDRGRRIVDINADGVPELVESYLANPGVEVKRTFFFDGVETKSWQQNTSTSPPASRYDLPFPLLGLDYKEHGAMMVDLNGDAMPDIFTSKKDEQPKVFINRGNKGATAWRQEAALPPNVEVSESQYSIKLPLHEYANGAWLPYGFELADINGDGLVDLFYGETESTETAKKDNQILLNTGRGWLSREDWKMPSTFLYYKSVADRRDGKRNAMLQDLNGDGFPDLLAGILGATPIVYYNNCTPEVLTSVVDGFGSELKVEYTRLNDQRIDTRFNRRVYEPLVGDLPAGHARVLDGRLVVSKLGEPNGTGGMKYQSRFYSDLRYDRLNEASLGFGTVMVLDEENQQMAETVNHRVFPWGGSPVETTQSVMVHRNDDDNSALPKPDLGRKILSKETFTYNQLPRILGNVGGTIYRPVQTKSVKEHWDPRGDLVSRVITDNLAFDPYGFVTSSKVTSLDDSTVTTSNQYTHLDEGAWRLGRLTSSTVTKAAPGKPSITRQSSFTYELAGANPTGFLKTETTQPGHVKGTTKTYVYDSYGNIESTTLSAPWDGTLGDRVSSAEYGMAGRFLEKETNSLNQSVIYAYDFNSSLLTGSTDISGLSTTFAYDPFGTLIRTYHLDGTVTGESTGLATNASVDSAVAEHLTNPIAYRRSKQSSGGPVATVYLDALGREVATFTRQLADATATSASSRYRSIWTVTQYNALGLKSRISDSFSIEAGAADPKYTTFNYDYINRLLKTTRADGSFSRMVQRQTVDLNGQPATYSVTRNFDAKLLMRWEDQHGRLVQSSDPSGLITRFSHDADGRLVSASVNGQLLLTNQFDIFGNKTHVTEANSGTSISTYNAYGEVTKTTNARNQDTFFGYDAHGRPETVTRPEGTFTTTYHAGPGASTGKVASISGPDEDEYSETFTYDSLGRPRTTTVKRFGKTFATSQTYDDLSRVTSSMDAGGLVTVNEYDPRYSILTAVRIGPGLPGAGTLLWKAGTFDVSGQSLTQTLAQGLALSTTFTPITKLPSSYRAVEPNGTIRQDKTYQWTAIGNLDSRKDFVADRTEKFAYDNNNRLIGSAVSAGTGAFNGTIPTNITYSPTGNLLSKPGASMVYANPRPHAVSSATVKGAQRTYNYNADGYVLNDTKRQYQWTSFGQLKTLTYESAPALQNLAGIQIFAPAKVVSEFDFDAGGNRIRQTKTRTEAGGNSIIEETHYVGSYELEERFANANEDPTRTLHRHSIGGFAVYTRITDVPGVAGTETRLSVILKDHLGSTDLIRTAIWGTSGWSVLEPEKQSFDAWGERRNPETLTRYRSTDADPFRTSAQDYDRGYTGHEQLDDSGLIHMNGRIYDPEVGRMLSPDPFVQVPENSQNFNRYSYVLNNPVNLTDPSGFSWVSKVFDKIGNWFSENWRTVVVIVVVAFVTWGVGSALSGAALSAQSSTAFASYSAATATTTASASLTASGMVVTGGIAGAVGGGLSAGLAGGDLGDVLRGAVVGGISGALAAGLAASPVGGSAIEVAGQSIIGGAKNEAMGGKFQDGFLSAAASSAAQFGPGPNYGVGGLIKSSVVGGTASSLGGGKFSNGAATAAFQYLVHESAGAVARPRASSSDANAKADAMLSRHTYGDSEVMPKGYTLQESFPDYRSGGLANLYSNGTRNVLAYAGTELLSGGNWFSNFMQAFGFKSPQYVWGLGLAVDLSAELSNLSFTGHSLGGGIASAAAIVTGRVANVFNAAGVHNNTLLGNARSNGSVNHYYSNTDVLYYLNYLTPARVPGNQTSLGFAGFHGIDGVVKALNR